MFSSKHTKSGQRSEDPRRPSIYYMQTITILAFQYSVRRRVSKEEAALISSVIRVQGCMG
jgi:hypothetical protein